MGGEDLRGARVFPDDRGGHHELDVGFAGRRSAQGLGRLQAFGVEGFGTSGRNRFRRPPVWNADFSLFKYFTIGRFRPELPIETANLFNHPNWGAPVTAFTANNVMLFTPSSYDGGGILAAWQNSEAIALRINGRLSHRRHIRAVPPLPRAAVGARFGRP